MSSVGALWGALVSPDRTLADDRTFKTPRIVPFLLILALALAGTALALRFSSSPALRDLTTREVLARLDRMMASAPPEQREEARRQTLASLQNQSPVVAFVSAGAFVIAQWLLSIVQIWLLFILVPQFMGGEEQPVETRRHRRTQYLALFACVPLALQELLRGVVLSVMDPSRLANVTTLAELQRAAEVNFSIPFLAGLTLIGTPEVLRGVVFNLTNPFVLWAAYVLIWGGASVLRISRLKTAIAGAVVFALFTVEGALLAQVGRLFGAGA